jgi:hypothetical protein
MVDYYEFLQISPNADTDTIHRVYRFLATRLHPDNPESGDADKFHLLKTAYDVLSNSEQRAAYDASCKQNPIEPEPLSASVDFMDSLDGELNRRLAVLAVLYYRRRTNPNAPEVALSEIEQRMGFPRDYLDFTTWYLLRKGYVCRADNSDFTLTADGVDFVESERAQLPILNKMLTGGNGLGAPQVERRERRSNAPIVLPTRMEVVEHRINNRNRLLGAAETNVDTLDRKVSSGGRRSTD